MPFDPGTACAARFAPVRYTWSSADVIRYHLALGAGAPECSGAELRYVYESGLRVLGTFAAVPASAASAVAIAAPGLGVDPDGLLHGEQRVALFGALPVVAESSNEARVTAVWDTGSFGVIDICVDTADGSGTPLARSTFRLLAPGAGGFGGDPPPKQIIDAPAGEPDRVVRIATLPQQAALYRMTGDRAPLHIDPAVARAHGFLRPPLPGLCTWGMVAKCVVDQELDGDVTALTGFAARFTGPVYPGETLEVSIRRTADARHVDARVLERDAPALSRGYAQVGRAALSP